MLPSNMEKYLTFCLKIWSLKDLKSCHVTFWNHSSIAVSGTSGTRRIWPKNSWFTEEGCPLSLFSTCCCCFVRICLNRTSLSKEFIFWNTRGSVCTMAGKVSWKHFTRISTPLPNEVAKEAKINSKLYFSDLNSRFSRANHIL